MHVDPPLVKMLAFLVGFAIPTVPKAIRVFRNKSKPDYPMFWFALGCASGIVTAMIVNEMFYK